MCLIERVFCILMQVLDTTHSQKTTKKVCDVLRGVSAGLVENAGLDLSALLTFTFGLVTDVLPMLKPTQSVMPLLSSSVRFFLTTLHRVRHMPQQRRNTQRHACHVRTHVRARMLHARLVQFDFCEQLIFSLFFSASVTDKFADARWVHNYLYTTCLHIAESLMQRRKKLTLVCSQRARTYWRRSPSEAARSRKRTRKPTSTFSWSLVCR